MLIQGRETKRATADYERRKKEIGLLLEARSRQAARKINLQFTGRKKYIRIRRRRVMTAAVLVTLLGVLGVLHELFF